MSKQGKRNSDNAAGASAQPKGFRADRRAALAALGYGAAAAALTPMLAATAQAQKAPVKGKEPTKEELEAAYAETEKLVVKGSTPDRPGIADWAQVQGQNLSWPAKYYLPWPAGIAHDVYQGWNGNKIGPPRATHMQKQNYYAWDFHIVRGEYMCAARDGKVTNVSDKEPPGNENANVIYIEHADGETSVYAHIGSDTALVAVGDKVLAGQKICQGSNESMHLHFCIWKGMIDYPCRFIDYTPFNGVPQYGAAIASGNKEPDESVTGGIKANYAKGEAAFAAKDYLNALKFYMAATAVEIRIQEYEASLERIGECRGLIDAEVADAIKGAKAGDFAGAETRFKEIRKKYGDYASGRIDAALEELKSDPKFKEWVERQRAERLWLTARAAEKFEKWDDALAAYRELKKLYKKEEPEYKEIQKKLAQLGKAKILEE
ncbi:MAG: M23 family metallopeptidase [Planctomycetes bacterium]|nr:M23 family metallopeptidase [Planctomycetota bacterium]